MNAMNLWGKAQPFFDRLNKEGRLDDFNPTDWLNPESEAGKFLKENFSQEERKKFRTIVIAQFAISS